MAIGRNLKAKKHIKRKVTPPLPPLMVPSPPSLAESSEGEGRPFTVPYDVSTYTTKARKVPSPLLQVARFPLPGVHEATSLPIGACPCGARKRLPGPSCVRNAGGPAC